MNAKEIIANFPKYTPMLALPAAELLMDVIRNTEGDYIEIGSAAGGSAVMAAKAMASRPGTVFCIDPFLGMNTLEGIDPLFRDFWKTMFHYGIEQRIVLFKQYTPPFPLAIHYHCFSVGLIDGNHNGDWPVKDFMELDSRVTDYLLIDNAEKPMVAKVVRLAIANRDWELYKNVEYPSFADSKKGVHNVLVALRRVAPVKHVSLAKKLKRYFKNGVPLC